jgi:hypothetical protein
LRETGPPVVSAAEVVPAVLRLPFKYLLLFESSSVAPDLFVCLVLPPFLLPPFLPLLSTAVCARLLLRDELLVINPTFDSQATFRIAPSVYIPKAVPDHCWDCKLSALIKKRSTSGQSCFTRCRLQPVGQRSVVCQAMHDELGRSVDFSLQQYWPRTGPGKRSFATMPRSGSAKSVREKPVSLKVAVARRATDTKTA